ncbi:MAG: 4-phosphoerythronate dehydrogenase [Rikenellaceae bacterium]
MKIVIDSAIPFIKGVFEPYCQVEYLDGKEFNNNSIADATALIIRTRTHCSKELLEGTSVRHIATATIGFDHIDIDYCRSHSIGVSTAAGCNARGVLQWIAALLAYLSYKEGWRPQQKRLGVVGVGNVGSLVSHYASTWGFEVICCDPPRQRREGGNFVTFAELAHSADIITLHTPLDATTHHIIDSESLKLISKKTLLVNTSRGEVVDTKALLSSGNPFALDVWEGEPNICNEALQKAIVATPHIAGYSLQGKANATTMAVRSIAHALQLPLTEWRSNAPTTQNREISWKEVLATITNYFDIEKQSNELKGDKTQFEALRNNYKYRNEYF